MTNAANTAIALPLLPVSQVPAMLQDAAFAYSVEHDDVFNMQLVLRAHGYQHSVDLATYAIWFGQQELEQPGISTDRE